MLSGREDRVLLIEKAARVSELVYMYYTYILCRPTAYFLQIFSVIRVI